MSNIDRREEIDRRLADSRQAVLDVAGQGSDAAAERYLDPGVEVWRQALRQRLAAARGSTYIYKDPNKIPGNPNDPRSININMGGAGHIIARPPGWGDTKRGKKERKAAKQKAYVGGGQIGGSATGGGGMAAGGGSATLITGTATRGMEYAARERLTDRFTTPASGGGTWKDWFASLLKDE